MLTGDHWSLSGYDGAVSTLPAAAALALAMILTGCASSAPPTSSAPALEPSAAPTGSPPSALLPTLAPLPWQYAKIVQPDAVLTVPSALPGGVDCHPCHYVAEDQLFAVAPWPSGLISIGLVQPPAQPLAFTSTDGLSWQPVSGLSARADASSNAVATVGAKTVLVGQEHNGASAWVFDGTSWTQAPEQDSLHVDYAAGGMNAAVGFNGQFVAGGYADDPLHDSHAAAVWRSSDGLTWQRDDDKGVFAGGRIWAMAAMGDTIVALGTVGDVIYGPAGAWRWTAADGWKRAQILPDGGGAMAAVTVGPNGFIAVGKNAKDLGAEVWTSTDGLVWQAVADQPAFHYNLQPLRMQSIVSSTDGYLVGGWRSDVAKGSGVVWRSTDGLSWSDPEWQTTFSGGQITGVVLTDKDAVIVGRTGYPDWNQATVWTRPWPY